MASFAALLLTSSNYKYWYFLIVMAPFYLIAWLFVVITCTIGKQVRYPPTLIYPIFFIQTIITLSNFFDAGYCGLSSCQANNIIEEFSGFNSSRKLSIGINFYNWTIIIYVVMVTIFAIDILRLRSLHPEDSE